MNYIKLLKDPKWQRKRLEVMNRDNWKCVKCSDEYMTLHVHHKEYKRGYMPWEYEMDNYETLCACCHKQAHSKGDKPSFKLVQKNPSHIKLFNEYQVEAIRSYIKRGRTRADIAKMFDCSKGTIKRIERNQY